METPDLRRHGPRASVLAAIVRLLELTLFRDGIANMSAQWNLWYEDVALPPF